MNDLPIPKHLQEYLTPIGNNNSEYEVTGTINCSCGTDEFEVWESNQRRIIKLVCRHCGKELLLFDESKHGWNGYVCHENFLNHTLPLCKYACPDCHNDVFHVTVEITSQGKQDFLEECIAFDDSFSPDDWVDGFESISVSLSCKMCQMPHDNWGVFETM